MYRVWLEEVLGFKLRAGRLSIEPVIPEDWPGYSLTFRYGRTEYRITVENGGERSTEEVQLVDDGESHAIHVYAGAPVSRTLAGAAGPTTIPG
jgi:cellobiose phosphorylase